MGGGKFQSNLQFLQVLDPERKVLVPFYAGLNATFSGLFSDVAVKSQSFTIVTTIANPVFQQYTTIAMMIECYLC